MPAPPNRETPLQRSLGDRIRARRDRLGLSQDQFAEKARIHRTYVASIEVGRRNPTLRTLARLARALEVDLGELTKGLQDLDED